MFYYFPTPSCTCIMDPVSNRVTPLYPELVLFDIAAKRIVFGEHCLAFRDTTQGAVRGIVGEVDTTAIAVFVPLAPGTGAGTGAGFGAGGAASTGAWEMEKVAVVKRTSRHRVSHSGGLCILSDSHGGHLLD